MPWAKMTVPLFPSLFISLPSNVFLPEKKERTSPSSSPQGTPASGLKSALVIKKPITKKTMMKRRIIISGIILWILMSILNRNNGMENNSLR